MSEKPDGGPAFPFAVDAKQLAHPGMTLRDHFAGQALTAAYHELARQVGEGDLAEFGWPDVAAAAYRIADAMLAERAKVDA